MDRTGEGMEAATSAFQGMVEDITDDLRDVAGCSDEERAAALCGMIRTALARPEMEEWRKTLNAVATRLQLQDDVRGYATQAGAEAARLRELLPEPANPNSEEGDDG